MYEEFLYEEVLAYEEFLYEEVPAYGELLYEEVLGVWRVVIEVWYVEKDMDMKKEPIHAGSFFYKIYQ